MKNIFSIAAIIATVFTFAACGNLEPENEEGKTGANVLTPVTDVVPVPDPDDPIPFIIDPGSGWTVSPGEVIFFKAYLLVDNKYVDVTNDVKTVFDFSYGSGKCVSGDSPDLKNGQEIVIRAVYDKKYPAESVGKFVIPAEYER